MNDFQVLFVDKTEIFVKWLFDKLAPKIKLEAQMLERVNNTGGTTDVIDGDLLEEFEVQDDGEFGPSKKFQKQKYQGNDRNQKLTSSNDFRQDNSRI